MIFLLSEIDNIHNNHSFMRVEICFEILTSITDTQSSDNDKFCRDKKIFQNKLIALYPNIECNI